MGYQENILHPEGGWALESSPQGSGHSTEPDRTPEVFEQCSQVHGVTLGDVLCSDSSWTLMILVGPFQVRIFCEPSLPTVWGTPLCNTFFFFLCAVSHFPRPVNLFSPH